MKLAKALSEADKKILSSYFPLADLLASLLGDFAEVVIHELSELSCSVVKIVNGFHTERKVGSPITDKALKILKEYQDNFSYLEKSYFSTMANGKVMKSTTHIILGEKGQPIGLFCINLNLSSSFHSILQTFQIPSEPHLNNEAFGADVGHLVELALQKAALQISNQANVTAKNKTKLLISLLNDSGIFELKEAINLVAEKLGITKHAVYKHLRELKSC
ncbi:PAS domain-containing protein [Avibacterium sp. 20-126]|uniref:helix-turn-helix transcriptional regulator n=1 Tax=Avibacterium sp. 20-126 TaxID=2911524 RepID=UPI00218471DF|nr:PAS domain-containing protein [Avibacterium sp. 20-126]